jgi:predicted oxidoreductase
MAWSPMGGGNLFADDDTDERNKRILAVANLLAEKYHTASDVILLSWLVTHPARIIPVVGTSKIERIQSAVDATNIKLEREDWFMLWRASTGREVA